MLKPTQVDAQPLQIEDAYVLGQQAGMETGNESKSEGAQLNDTSTRAGSQH